MRKLLLIFLGVLLLCGTISISVLAWDQGQRQGFWKDLNLTSDQQQKISAILKDFKDSTQPLRKDLSSKMKELQQLWNAESLEQNQINAKTDEINGLRIQLVTKSRAMQKQIQAILTPDQLKQLETMQANRKNQHHQAWNGFGFMGGFGFGGNDDMQCQPTPAPGQENNNK